MKDVALDALFIVALGVVMGAAAAGAWRLGVAFAQSAAPALHMRANPCLFVTSPECLPDGGPQ